MFTLASPGCPAHRSSEIGAVHRLTVPRVTLQLWVTPLILSQQRLRVSLSLHHCYSLNGLVLQQRPVRMTWAHQWVHACMMHPIDLLIQLSSCCPPCCIYTQLIPFVYLYTALHRQCI